MPEIIKMQAGASVPKEDNTVVFYVSSSGSPNDRKISYQKHSRDAAQKVVRCDSNGFEEISGAYIHDINMKTIYIVEG